MIAKQDRPVSQIFLSCDLTGSTNFKQRTDLSEHWQKVFLQFYREFPQRIATTQVEEDTVRLKFELWKPVGDELIYWCAVKSEIDVYDAVRTWLRAMRRYETEHLEGNGMGTKGGAFVATFPGPDSRSSVPRRPDIEVSDDDVVDLNRQAHSGQLAHSKYLYDYFGPSIDTGFRVTNLCEPRYFTLSVEVTMAMTGLTLTPGEHSDRTTTDDFLLLHYQSLKGVWGGRKYPIFAIDRGYDDPVNAAFMKFENRPESKDVHDLCNVCYQSANWPSQLYLPEAINELFHREPVDPLADYVSTTSAGAESVPEEPAQSDELSPDAPLGGIYCATCGHRDIHFTRVEDDGSRTCQYCAFCEAGAPPHDELSVV